MIDIYGSEHTWVCSPCVLYNDDRKLKVHIKLATIPEISAQDLIEKKMSLEEACKSSMDFVHSKIVKIEGLKIGGKKIETFKELLSTGVYHELVGWCRMAVQSERLLTEAEIKNSFPGSDSGCLIPESTAKTARKRKKS